MVATWEEMEQHKLETWQRDYCAHKTIILKKCQTVGSVLDLR